MAHPRSMVLLAFLVPGLLAAQPRPAISVGGGLTVPLGDATDFHGAGFAALVAASFPISPRVALQAALEYHDFRRKDEPHLVELGYEPEAFVLGGGFLDGGHRRIMQAAAEVQLALLPWGSPIVPYAHVGGGFARVRRDDLGVYFLAMRDSYDGASEWAPSLTAGAGMRVRILSGVAVFVETEYQRLFTDGTATSMVPIQIGLAVDPDW